MKLGFNILQLLRKMNLRLVEVDRRPEMHIYHSAKKNENFMKYIFQFRQKIAQLNMHGVKKS